MTVQITLECDRIGCDAQVVDEDNYPESETFGHCIQSMGWGYDNVGYDRVLHCPEHRSES